MAYTKVDARNILERVRYDEKRKTERLSQELRILEKHRKYALDRDQVEKEFQKKLSSHDKTQKHVRRSSSDREGHYSDILQRKVDWKKEVEYNEKHNQPISDEMYRKANDGLKE